MTYKHLTFWSLVDRLDNYKRCYYCGGRSNGGPMIPINCRQFQSGMPLASDLCPGVSVQYDHNMPVKIMIR